MTPAKAIDGLAQYTNLPVSWEKNNTTGKETLVVYSEKDIELPRVWEGFDVVRRQHMPLFLFCDFNDD